MDNSVLPDLYETMLNNFLSDIRKMQKSVFNTLPSPLEASINAIHEYADFTRNTFEYFSARQQEILGLYPPFNYGLTSENCVNENTQYTLNKLQRVALVTGGTGGIGTEICRALYKKGIQVITTYISQEAENVMKWQHEQRNAGYSFEVIECDVTNFKNCKKVARQLEKEFNHIDILVNCAGITRDATLKKMEQDKWHAVLDTNLDSVFNVTRNLINGMIKRKFGRIVNISSVNGQKGQFGQTNYSAAKAGMIGFTKSLALELADSGITVNCVCPGYVGTTMVEAMPEDILEDIIEKIPMGRLARPAEIGKAVAFLVADDSGYITGSELSVNGGLFTG